MEPNIIKGMKGTVDDFYAVFTEKNLEANGFNIYRIEAPFAERLYSVWTEHGEIIVDEDDTVEYFADILWKVVKK